MTLRAWLAMLRRRWLVLTSVLLVTCGAMAVVHERPSHTRPVAASCCSRRRSALPNVYIDPTYFPGRNVGPAGTEGNGGTDAAAF